jgi:hypothetical protein
MTTPNTAQGRDYAIGAKKTTPWGTEAALGDGFGLVLPIGGLKGFDAGAIEYAPRLDHDQGPIPKGGDFGPYKAADFSIECDMLHDPGPLGTLIALLFGTAGTPDAGGATSHLHTFTWKTNTVGLFATVATEMPNIIHVCPSAKPTSWSLTVGDHGKIKSVLKLRGNKIITGVVNTDTQMGALTYVDRSNRLKFSGMTYKMNAFDSGGVAAENPLTLNSFTVDYERPLDSVLCAGADSIVEPIENGFSKIGIKLGFPRMTSTEAAYLATMLAGTPQKALFTFTGNFIETNDHYYCFRLFFPRLIITDPKNVVDQIIHSELTLVAETSAAAPGGMNQTTPYVVIENMASTDYLA